MSQGKVALALLAVGMIPSPLYGVASASSTYIVPEPITLSLLLLGGLLLRRRR
jgi:hypothetical protein